MGKLNDLTPGRIIRAIQFRLVVKPRKEIPRRLKKIRDLVYRVVFQMVDGSPIPPPHLISITTGNEDVAWFIKSGRLGAVCLKAILKKNQTRIEEFSTILDFGCGIGRVLRHFRTLEKTKIYGTDYNPELIEWCQKNLKFADFRTNPLHGPLDFENETFDLIYALSVFTHLVEEHQYFWINELNRVLKSGGFLFITVHGASYLHTMRPEDHERFRSGEFVAYGSQDEGSNICTAHHPDRFVREKLGRGMILIEHVPTGALGNPHQDVYLFQKPIQNKPGKSVLGY